MLAKVHTMRALACTFTRRFTSLHHAVELPSDNLYERRHIEEFKALYKTEYTDTVPGYATVEGTARYSTLRADIVDAKHFRHPFHDPELKISSIGFGSYQGAPEEIDDIKTFNALIDSVRSGGVNVVDTALNYRYMKAERSIGAALRFLAQNYQITRDQLFIASKGGYLAEDADKGEFSQAIVAQLIEQGLITAEDIVTECHCMHPNFLKYSLEKSLANLGLQTLDLYYLQNSSEQQLSLIGEEQYFERLKKAVEYLQSEVTRGRIRSYGLATWLAFRVKKDEERIYLSLQNVKELVEKVAGKDNGFKYIQLPANAMMPEAYAEEWQEFKNDNGEIENMIFLKAARLLELNVITSSPLLQGSLIQVPLPTDVFKCRYLGAKHLQFIRSLPAPSLLSTLVGMKTNHHVKKNLEVIQQPPLTEEEFVNYIMNPERRVQEMDATIEIE